MNHPILFAQVLKHAQDAVLITDAELDAPGPHILYVNNAFLSITGYSEAELLGQSPRVLQGPHTDRAVLDDLRRCLDAGQAFVGSVVNYRKDGTAFEIEWHVSPVFDADGQVSHYLSIHRDVTERRRFNQQIEHYRHYQGWCTLRKQAIHQKEAVCSAIKILPRMSPSLSP